LSGKGLPDDPNLLRIPREFVEETEELEFTREDLPLLVLRLPRFARTFFEALFAEELGLEINGMNDAERQRVSAMTVSLEGDEEHDALLPLLYTFIDYCELYEAHEELSTPEGASENQSEILELTELLVQKIRDWADETGRVVLAGSAADLAQRIGRWA
jgi:hypothetical protein